MEDILNFFRSRLKKKDLERVERCIIRKFSQDKYREEFFKHVRKSDIDLSACRPVRRERDYTIFFCDSAYVIDYGKVKLKVDLQDASSLELLEYNLESLEYITLVQVLSLSKDGAVAMKDFSILG